MIYANEATSKIRIAKVYNDAAEKNAAWGRMYGVQGDVSKKVSICALILCKVS